MKHHHNRAILTDSELYESLSVYSHSTRVAILLILSQKISPEDALHLTWSRVRDMRLTKSSAKLLNSMPRHLNFDLVFWEIVDNEVTPLFDLPHDVERLIGVFTLGEFRELYDNMICVEQSSREFIRTMSKEVFDRG